MANGLLKVAAALLALVVATPPANALPRGYTGSDLIQNCSLDAVVCDVYLRTLLDGHDTLLVWTQSASRICPPRSFEPSELWQMVSARMLARPERLGASAGSLVLDALQVAYRCPSGPVAAVPVLAPQNGVDLAGRCTNRAPCEPALIGALDAHQTLVDWERIPRPYTCLPEASTLADWRLVLLKYLGAHLDQLNYSAASLTLLAMTEAYPC
jgi:hypothetical protein